MLRLFTIIMELIGFALKRGKSKEEKKEEKFDEALAEDNFEHLSDDFSDSFDGVQSKVRRDPE